MTELDTLKRAKMYIDKMANGVNPLTDGQIREDDFINNVRIARCLFYVSDILNKVIQNGGVVGVKAKFSISDEQLKDFQFSEKPISISEVTNRINALKHSNAMRSLSNTKISSWLVNHGFLEIYENEKGQKTKRPTKQGQGIGISLEQREGTSGIYSVPVYHFAAQRFIIDKLNAIIAEE